MKRYLVAPVAVVVLALGASQALAHHSFAATYVETESITIEGELVQFQARNPHAYVHVMVKDKDGSMVRWVAEWGSPAQLSSQGVERDTIRPGDYVIISGNPGRNPVDHRIRLLKFMRPKDGWSWGVLPNQVIDR